MLYEEFIHTDYCTKLIQPGEEGHYAARELALDLLAARRRVLNLIPAAKRSDKAKWLETLTENLERFEGLVRANPNAMAILDEENDPLAT